MVAAVLRMISGEWEVGHLQAGWTYHNNWSWQIRDTDSLSCLARREFVEAPSLEEIVHYDQWARRHVAEAVDSRNAVAA